MQTCYLESILPTNFCKEQMCQHKVNGAKDAVLFHQHFCSKFTPCFRQQLFYRAPYFGTFWPNAVGIKSIKNYLVKILLALTPKMLVTLTHTLPGVNFTNIL